jgi:hypothetical protein
MQPMKNIFTGQPKINGRVGVGELRIMHVHQEITCDMCSAAATLGLTTSQFAMTRVFGTLPSV